MLFYFILTWGRKNWWQGYFLCRCLFWVRRLLCRYLLCRCLLCRCLFWVRSSNLDVSCVDVSLVDRSVVIKIVYKHTRTEPRMIVFELFRQYFLVLSTTEFVSISVGCEKCHLTYDQMPEIHASHKLVIFCIKLIVHLHTNPRLLILIRN